MDFNDYLFLAGSHWDLSSEHPKGISSYYWTSFFVKMSSYYSNSSSLELLMVNFTELIKMATYIQFISF